MCETLTHIQTANDSFFIKATASIASDGSLLSGEEVCSNVWLSHTHREGTLDSPIRHCHMGHFNVLSNHVLSRKRRRKKEKWDIMRLKILSTGRVICLVDSGFVPFLLRNWEFVLVMIDVYEQMCYEPQQLSRKCSPSMSLQVPKL